MLQNLQIDLLVIIIVTTCIASFHCFTENTFLWGIWGFYSHLNLIFKKIITGEAFIFYAIPFLFYMSLEAIAVFIFSDQLSIADIIFTGLFPHLGVYVFLHIQSYFMELRNGKRNVIHLSETDKIDFSNFQENSTYIFDGDIVENLNYFEKFFQFLLSFLVLTVDIFGVTSLNNWRNAWKICA